MSLLHNLKFTFETRASTVHESDSGKHAELLYAWKIGWYNLMNIRFIDELEAQAAIDVRKIDIWQLMSCDCTYNLERFWGNGSWSS